MSKFLVTGGAGFIGSHIVHRLVRDNHEVRVLDNFSSGKMFNLEGTLDKIELIKGDICSFDNCDKATEGVDFVLHQAALRSVPKSMDDPTIYNEVNISGTLNMLEACRKNGVKRFVFASSSSVYGEVKKFPEKESFFPQPISPYALTKLTGEYYCNIFALYYGVETVSLRYFNVFGPRQALDDEYAVVIPKFIHCMLHDEPVPVYGNGRQSRDFTFVDNVVNANILAASVKVSGGKIFNIASGKDYTILNLTEILNKILKKNIALEFLDKRKGDVFRTLADISNAKSYLGFKPRVNFVQGLEKTVEYFKQNA
ncbi:MAG: SDR family oxidoreductase [Candidatus Omnitrophota bacterium]|jgi:nucleoside-diphosphate-sugar epimerase